MSENISNYFSANDTYMSSTDYLAIKKDLDESIEFNRCKKFAGWLNKKPLIILMSIIKSQLFGLTAY